MSKYEREFSRRRHAQIHLPPLDAEQAVMVVRVLKEAIDAIWRAHGDEMGEYLERAYAGSMPMPFGAVSSGSRSSDDATDF